MTRAERQWWAVKERNRQEVGYRLDELVTRVVTRGWGPQYPLGCIERVRDQSRMAGVTR